MARNKVSPEILRLCEKITAKRPRTVIDHIIEFGHVTSEELATIHGYDHPPRAVRDVREHGIPIETFRVNSTDTGRPIAAYRFGDPSQIKRGRIGGRKTFSKKFKEQLVERYESRDAFTGERLESRYLQIDHRVPYEIAGEGSHEETDLDEYMLIDSSGQRAKSWSCEHCENWLGERKESICRSCFWAYPEKYEHVACQPTRRVDIEWRGEKELSEFERLRNRARRKNMTVADFLKRISKT